LRDWDFYYRLSTGTFGSASFGLDYEKGPVLTRFVALNMWILFLPTAILLVGLFLAPRKSVSLASTASCVVAIAILSLGYLVAYLPVAMPEWWGGRRPDFLIEEAQLQHRDGPEQGADDQSVRPVLEPLRDIPNSQAFSCH
jgi:hypothetical protein